MPPILTTVATQVFLLFGSILFGSLAVITAPIPPRGHWSNRCAVWWSRALLFTGGARLDVQRESELTSTPCVFVANHQSLYDIPVLLATLPIPARFLAKRSLFRIPFFGWGIRACGFVPVDRADRVRAKQALAVARSQLQSGNSVLVFPEETRSPDGRIRPFKRGGLLLAILEQVPVVPIGIRGTRAIKHKESFWVRPGKVRVRYGRPIEPPGRRLGSRALTASLRDEVIRLSGELPFTGNGEGVPSVAVTGEASTGE